MKKIILFLISFMLIISSLNAQDLYRARQDGHVDSVYNGTNLPDAYRGDGVIIGVTDWGFDYTHPVFYDSTLTHYRVLRAWDQYRTAGPAPVGFNYGTELVGQEQLLAAQCDTVNIYGHHYHATHVASIAGGGGVGTPYRGVAPDAEFIFATFRPDEQSVIDAFEWMYQVAQQEQKRLVINMSWGLYWMDNFDGTGPVGRKMQELSDLGVVFVTSGGNNGDVNFHLGHTFSAESDTVFTRYAFPGNYANNYYGGSITMTNSPHCPFSVSFTCYNYQAGQMVSTPFYNTADGDASDEGCIYFGADSIVYSITLQQSDEEGRPEARLVLKRPHTISSLMYLTVTAQSGDFHAWNVAELTTGVGNWGGEFTGRNAPKWKGGDVNFGLGTPASVDCAITVAAHVSRYQMTDSTMGGGNICTFSSYGPTIDGRDKPDISAPGQNLCAAASSYADNALAYDTSVVFNNRTYGFTKLSGTSMSSPFATGVVALLLQANPTLTPQQVKEVLIYSATHDEFTEASGMVRFGHGKVNAYQAILRALNSVGFNNFENHEDIYTVFPNPTSDKIFISTPNSDASTTAFLYDMNGRLLSKIIVNQGVNVIDLGNRPNGCYLLKIVNPHYSQTEKIIKSK